MAEDTGTATMVDVTVRFFAAARSAAGTDDEGFALPGGSTVDDLVDLLAARTPELAKVLPRCSYLCEWMAVRDTGRPLISGQTIDVLPPFAGG